LTLFNFSAGPAVLPLEVLRTAQAELLDWQGSGMSVMEMSHRGPEFERILAEAEADLRSLVGIPTHYKVLFLQGGGYGQFSGVPLNLLPREQTADYVVSGGWSQAAEVEARKFGTTHIVASGESGRFTAIPPRASWAFSATPAYVYVCSNETVYGNEMHHIPADLPAPLVCDASSHFLSRPLDIERYGLLYAGAQKNVGPSGVTMVIVREDLLDRARADCPTVMHYKTMAAHHSMLNTPPTFSIYMVGLTLKHLIAQGGLLGAQSRAIDKAQLLYDTLDQSALFKCPVTPADRSRMNVVFTSGDAQTDDRFLAFAKARGMIQLKGHRSVGGLRASLYNAMPHAGVVALAAAITEFERSH
jgi:phosphoserine aminotransferase